jgi:activating signal cointegrator complex subunit 3
LTVTDLLPLRPLPVSALNNEIYQQMYSFEYFNSVQTQIFHCLYHTDRLVNDAPNQIVSEVPVGMFCLAHRLDRERRLRRNWQCYACLIGTVVVQERSCMRCTICFRFEDGKVVYIAPLKALVRERVDDWREKIENRLGKRCDFR